MAATATAATTAAIPARAPERPVRVLPDPPPLLPPSARPDVEAFLRNAAAAPPLVRHADGLAAEAREEAVDLCAAAVEKHPVDVERCMQTIKEAMDRRFGGRWHAVAGRGFAFAVTHQELLHVYVGGSVGVLLWKL